MKFDMELLQKAERAFRSSWGKGHFLIYDEERREVMEHENEQVRVWYWMTPEEFERASEDLTAPDWRYVWKLQL